MGQTGFFSLVWATSWGRGKLWIQTSCTLLKNWLYVTPCPGWICLVNTYFLIEFQIIIVDDFGKMFERNWIWSNSLRILHARKYAYIYSYICFIRDWQHFFQSAYSPNQAISMTSPEHLLPFYAFVPFLMSFSFITCIFFTTCQSLLLFFDGQLICNIWWPIICPY